MTAVTWGALALAAVVSVEVAATVWLVLEVRAARRIPSSLPRVPADGRVTEALFPFGCRCMRCSAVMENGDPYYGQPTGVSGEYLVQEIVCWDCAAVPV